jgi:hypothetical protein
MTVHRKGGKKVELGDKREDIMKKSDGVFRTGQGEMKERYSQKM